jgi:hypothetical protein
MEMDGGANKKSSPLISPGVAHHQEVSNGELYLC